MEMDLQTELKKEYKNKENWLRQFGNILYALIWNIGLWIALSMILLGVVCIAFVWSHDGSPVTFIEIQKVFKYFTFVVGVISAALILICGIPAKLQNVFKEIATDRITRYQKIRKKIESQIDTTDALLIQYGLITKDDVNSRKELAPEIQPTVNE